MSNKIHWRRTQIGGDTLHHDFCAYVDGNINIARIFRTTLSEGLPIWSVNLVVGHPAFSGMSANRRDAVVCVEEEFARFLKTDDGKQDPQLWPHDHWSGELRILRERNPQRYGILVEDFRSGRAPRRAWSK